VIHTQGVVSLFRRCGLGAFRHLIGSHNLPDGTTRISVRIIAATKLTVAGRQIERTGVIFTGSCNGQRCIQKFSKAPSPIVGLGQSPHFAGTKVNCMDSLPRWRCSRGQGSSMSTGRNSNNTLQGDYHCMHLQFTPGNRRASSR